MWTSPRWCSQPTQWSPKGLYCAPLAAVRAVYAHLQCWTESCVHARGSFSGQPWQHVIQLRQFNLQLALTAARMPGENVQNELRPIDHSAFCGFFDVSLLHG